MKFRNSTRAGLIGLFCFLAITCSAWVIWDNWGRFITAPTTSNATQNVTTSAETTQHGAYLARIGGCITCHTAKGGEPLAGGRRIDTPFGPVFSSNLTPSTSHGIGLWTLNDFEQALKWGRSRSGRLLLPAFPYNHTSVLTSSDVQALYAWLKTVPAIDQSSPEHRLVWPLGTQPVIAVWRSLFFSPSTFQHNDHESASWNRGAYLVQGAGHCAACHGQRNALGSFPRVDDLSGGFLSPQLWVAPSLVSRTHTTLVDSTEQEIATLLRTGQNPRAQTSGPMAEFVQYAGQYMSDADAQAMAVYLKSKISPLATVSTAASQTSPALAASTSAAQTIYKTHCATCHGESGQGKPNVYPALANNPAVVLDQPENLIQMTLYGGYGPSTLHRPRPFGMPPYLFTLNNQQIADVLNHVRSSWGNQGVAITPMQVDRVRAAVY